MKARGEPGVVADKIPPQISSKLLDYKREGRGKRAASVSNDVPVIPEETVKTKQAPSADIPTRAPLDFPTLTAWLRSCEDDMVRGRDRHNYTMLDGVFAAHGFTRIDDILLLSPETLMDLAKGEALNVPLALVHRVFKFAKEDIAILQGGGKL